MKIDRKTKFCLVSKNNVWMIPQWPDYFTALFLLNFVFKNTQRNCIQQIKPNYYKGYKGWFTKLHQNYVKIIKPFLWILESLPKFSIHTWITQQYRPCGVRRMSSHRSPRFCRGPGLAEIDSLKILIK